MQARAIKYSTLAIEYSPLAAQKRIDKSQKRHPDWDYAILVNMRAAGGKYIAARVHEVVVDVPDPDDMDLPPLPPQPSLTSSAQQYQDWKFERDKRLRLIAKLMEPVKKALREWPPGP